MNEYGLLIVSGIPVLALGAVLVWSWRRISLVGTVIVGATLVHEIILIVFPVWYSVFTDFRLEGNMRAPVGADDLLRVMTGESVFVLMFALAFVMGWPRSRPQGGRLIGAAVSRNQARRERLIFVLLIVAGCLIYARAIIQPSSELLVGSGGMLDQAFRWFQAIFWFTSLAACALVFTRGRVLFTHPMQALLAAIPLLALLVIGFMTGMRGRIMWVISLLVVTGILNRKTKFVALGVAIGIVMVPLFVFLGGAYRFIAKDEFMSGTGRSEMFVRLYEEGRSRVVEDLKNMGAEFLYAVAWRAQGPRNSALLYKQYDSGAGAGFTTYLGSIFFPIPRMVWPEKPAAGSTDGTLSSSAIYLVMELAYGYEAGASMGPSLASAHAYWEGGWGWLVAAGYITGLLWSIIFNLCRRLPEGMAAVVVFAFAAALLIDGMLTMLTPLYAMIITWWQWVLPVLILYQSAILLLPQKGDQPHVAPSLQP
jgi:hypothetical protein